MQTFPDSLRILSPRALLQGAGNGDALENVIPDELADGALCYVTETGVESLYQLNKTSNAAVSVPDVIATIRGTGVLGRWVKIAPGSGGGGDIPLANGTLAVPSLNFLNSLSLGAYRIQNNLMGWARDGFLGYEFGDNTIVNLDPLSPATVRYLTRWYPPPVAGVNETAILYSRLEYTALDPQKAAIYVEIDGTQVDTYGPAIKVIHVGHGDAFYVALFDNGVAFEAASFFDGSRGIISTLQGNFPNSVLFNALWEQPSVPNFGMYYADASMGNAFVVHKRAGAADGVTAIKVMENITTGGGRIRFDVNNDGSADLQSLLATAGVPLRESPELRFKSAGWDGAASDEHKITMKVVSTSATAFELRFYQELAGGGATLLCAITSGQLLDMQNGSLVNVASIQSLNNRDDYVDGRLTLQLDPTNVDEQVGLVVMIREGGIDVVKRVFQGPADSAGVGFRALRVLN